MTYCTRLEPAVTKNSRMMRAGVLVALVIAACGSEASVTEASAASVAVTISPESATVPTSGTQAFRAAVTGSAESRVTWSIQEGSAGGSVDNGQYTAPGSPGVFHVVVTSVADSTKRATATVTVTGTPLPADTVAPTLLAFAASGTASPVQISTFTGSDNVGVTGYLITESATPPSPASASWQTSVPTSYGTMSSGNVVLYPWVRDAAGNVSPPFGAPATLTLTPPTSSAKMGTNLNWCADWDPEKMAADLVWCARPWALGSGNADNDAWAPLDSRGWPVVTPGTQFGSVFEMAPWPGVYKLSFKNRQGTSGDTVSQNYGNVTLTNRQHSASTNVTTYDVTVTSYDNGSAITLRWAGSTGGVTDVHLMRPLKDGSGWHAIGTPLADYIIDRLRWFTTIRPMQTQGGESGKSSGLDGTWGDRTKPWGPQTRSGVVGRRGGVAVENLVAMANQANKDLWITIPFLADDDYIRKMAQTIRYGSDGANPYTSDQANPVFAPLKANLNLYVEHGNEIWNSSAGYWAGENMNLTVTDWAPGTNYGFAWCSVSVPAHVKVGTNVYRLLSAGGSTAAGVSGTSGSVAPSGTGTFGDNTLVWQYLGPLTSLPGWIGNTGVDYTPSGSGRNGLSWRRVGYLAVRQSLIFRSVFGDAAMMTRVRPVMGVQHSRYATIDEPLFYIRDVWGGAAGQVNQYGNVGHPVSYYLFGVASAPYIPDDNAVVNPATPTTIIDSVVANLNATTAGYPVPAMSWISNLCNSFGIKLLAYEGGDNLIPALLPGGATASTLQNARDASFDAVLGARMGAAIGANGLPAPDQSNYVYGRLFKEWNDRGGGLFMHFTLGSIAGSGGMMGLCPPSSQSGSDPRLETGPKWDAVKAFARAWGQ